MQSGENTSPAQWSGLREEGNIAFKNGAFDEAIRLYSKAIEMNPQEVTLFSNRSAAYSKKIEFKAALEDAEAAIAIDKTFPKAYSRLHAVLCNLGRFQEAAQKLKQGVENLESSGAPKVDIKHLQEMQAVAEEGQRAIEEGQRFLAEGNFTGAEKALIETYRAFPYCASVAFMIAEARAAKHPEEVTRTLMSFTQTHSNDPSYLYTWALASYYRGPDGLKSAQTILRQVLEWDPDNKKASTLLKKIRFVESHKEKGNTAFKEKRFRDAIEAYTAAIDLDSTNVRMVATLRGNQAAAKMELKEYSSALLDCDFAINNGGGSAKLHARRGRIHEQLNNYADAVRDIQRAAEMDESYNGELRRMKASAKKGKRKDYYGTLGLPKNEDNDASIKRAYKKACLQWHPDKWAHAQEDEKNHAEKMFKEVGEAFSILSDPQKKRMYDNGHLDNAVEGAAAPGMPPFSDDMINLMHMFGGGLSQGEMPRGFGYPGAHQGNRQTGFQFRFF
ncbi:putative TPR-repeat-containing chaperone protein DNAJ [Trypanosoma grayi]|uniref:putative TPR-repeat-containing chaperone protein DNAJ n=1 Tax=Trypanosoma grayi TaxID=71804 RepID=UPI0004F49164|nr:putative TPR-repeat-containing chaperone protein DNAJ [Trypanosoma grayi]KEG14210.1 putative TPR-repeat-containing chaperone protein DNAJ [Trypanosoma grayi]